MLYKFLHYKQQQQHQQPQQRRWGKREKGQEHQDK